MAGPPAPVPFTLQLREDQELVRSLRPLENNLDEWEQDFLADVTKRVFSRKWILSVKQRAKAKKILKERK